MTGSKIKVNWNEVYNINKYSEIERINSFSSVECTSSLAQNIGRVQTTENSILLHLQ